MIEFITDNGDRCVIDPLAVIGIVECEMDEGRGPLPAAKVFIAGNFIFLRDSPRHVVSSILAAQKKERDEMREIVGYDQPK